MLVCMECCFVTIAWRIDSSWYRNGDGHVVFGGSPLRAFKLSDAGVAIATALEQSKPLGAGHEQLTDRLVQAGALHPSLSDAVSPHEITVIIPAYVCNPEDLPTLQTLITQFQNHPVIVVDDASPIEVTATGITLLRHPTNRGPAAARNTALQQVSSQFIAFVDLDTSITSENLCILASHFEDRKVGVVTPRITSRASPSIIGRYEVARSPLDMGLKPALVKPLTRVSFVPSAIMLARTDAIRQCNGFNEDMRFGEDVDLVWRFVDTGVMCRYEPEIMGVHTARTSLRQFFKQRFNYGTSAAVLAHRHGSYAAPFVANIFLFGFWICLAFWLPLMAGLFLFAQIISSFVVLLRTGDNLFHACATVITGIVNSARLFADAMTRVWLLPALLISVFYPQILWTVLLSFVLPGLFEWFRFHTLDPFTYVALRAIDNSAYCIGVTIGTLKQKSLAALSPKITVWRSRRAK